MKRVNNTIGLSSSAKRYNCLQTTSVATIKYTGEIKNLFLKASPLTAILVVIFVLIMPGCSNNDNKSDAYGNFETDEVIVSAENGGKLTGVLVDEGSSVSEGMLLATGDTIATELKKKQLEAQKEATASKRAGLKAQMAVYREQRKTAKTNFDRFSRMYAEGASTRKQIDDLEGQLMVIDRQMETVKTQFTSLDKEIEVLNTQVAQLNDLQNRSSVKSPISGIVLERYHKAGEMVNPGAALFKLADLSYLTLRVYVSGAQLAHVKLNQNVKVLIDQDAKSNQMLEGTVTWISSEAEFTPKIIQTKEERVKQVYAVKVKVHNDGRLKIGMPGEIKFQ